MSPRRLHSPIRAGKRPADYFVHRGCGGRPRVLDAVDRPSLPLTKHVLLLFVVLTGLEFLEPGVKKALATSGVADLILDR